MNASKYTLNHKYDNVEITHSFETVLLSDVLEQVEQFLRGCGFVVDGELQIVESQPIDNTLDGLFDLSDITINYDDYKFEDYPHEMDLMESSNTTEDISLTESRCSICRMSKDVMVNYVCHDKNCPKGSW